MESREGENFQRMCASLRTMKFSAIYISVRCRHGRVKERGEGRGNRTGGGDRHTRCKHRCLLSTN